MGKMQAEDWKKVKNVLNEALELEISERRDFLNKFDAEIRAEVESLLAFEEESESVMRLSAVEFSTDFFDVEANSRLVGQRFGVYKIIREIGQGGMGAVFLAKRADRKFEQKVALKLLKREMNTSALRRRFEQEQKILASLEHPTFRHGNDRRQNSFFGDGIYRRLAD